ncbi:DUF7734 family protein [Prochlorothrix hollandica]|uniref:DUF7734 domain-containing protein n=1 Tax=Prochlorothrix hollandica PCC 9006 = CALU 1027 TaxID=317619 RepID=A0A0M2Q3M7_PROHO|nr:hypothetical protein [Prochlorothrix hollandica]KKJ01549.1 hypothetical protein PROH_04425 [Prochlorothrix hollandica PCC 9006 = CALU 1027]
MVEVLGRLEQYSRRFPQEVLVLEAQVGDQQEQVMIFKGISSLLLGATAFDPDVPVLPDAAVLVSLDRLRSPYTPQQPQYLAQGLTPDAVETLLTAAGC